MPSKPAPAPRIEAAPASVPAPAPTPALRLVRFRNRMTQILAVHILDADGKLHHVEIPAMGDKEWPRMAQLADYGVDVGIKIRRNLLSIEPIKP